MPVDVLASAELTQAVKAEARRLGFHLAGVTTPAPPGHLEVYENWLAEGRHGQMGYLAGEQARLRRGDPRLVLAECQSILVLGMVYPAQAPGTAQAQELSGKIAAYAWGQDYHAVLAERMKALVAYLEARLGRKVSHRWYTDTGPVLERELAQRAGLGWIGKNTCLINPELGSYFFLGEIFLEVELVADQPFLADRCGTCRRCLEACPTGCILPDRTLDARRCISYLTIELKGAIPVSLRPLLGDWVFGCDVCQQVCPWNIRFGGRADEPAFQPRPEIANLDLKQVLSLRPEAFSRLFKGSAIKRARRSGFLRNAVVVLANQADLQALPGLRRALLSDPDPLVRSHAAWALGQFKEETAQQVLQQAAQVESDQAVLEEIWRASV